ncbi:single hybrid motif-containing protein [Rhodotorula diobovata]|uniref:Single hybrid motif-containing protein n=1 Tax=Rhodotorula diobovata TaxID=5288 RepID=A0A5C5G1D3_9BASI|nr:single hybrid motif-containing protein [Rhodotorula diobovata]
MDGPGLQAQSRSDSNTLRERARPKTVHGSSARSAYSNFLMPAMSPTMTEGGISEWKVKEGDAFEAGAVLLTIETDKASIDVEAQDDGIMGKILENDGAAGVPVGKLIAILAEEGDDLANIEVPSQEAAATPSSPSPAESKSEAAPTSTTPSDAPTPSPATPSPTPSATHAHPQHSKPLLPSVLRLLALARISDASVIKATGHNGTLTKGDVLAYTGAISNPRGSLPAEKPDHGHPAHDYTPTPKDVKKPVEVLLDGPSIRRLVAAGLGSASAPPKPAFKEVPVFSFDSILDDYLPPSRRSTSPSSASATGSPVPPPPAARKSAFDDILGL